MVVELSWFQVEDVENPHSGPTTASTTNSTFNYIRDIAAAIPAYQDYAIHTNMKEVMGIGDQATEAVEKFIVQNNVNPTQMEETGFYAISPLVKSVTVDGQSGAVRLTISFPPVKDRALLFVPSLDENKKMIWKCTGEDIEWAYLPSRCR
jgi:hypothetical protein